MTAFLSHVAKQAFITGFQNLDDRGVQLKPANFEHILTNPFRLDIHPPEAPTLWKVTTNASLFWAPLLVSRTSAPGNSKISRAERLMTQLVPRPPPTSPRVLSDQVPCPHDASGQRPPLCSNNADLPRELSSAETSKSPSPKRLWLRAQASIKKGGFGTRHPVLQSLAAFLASSSSADSLCNSLWAECNDTHTTPTWPLLRPNAAATSGRTQFGVRTARQAPGAAGPNCPRQTRWTLLWSEPPKKIGYPSNYTRSAEQEPCWRTQLTSL